MLTLGLVALVTSDLLFFTRRNPLTDLLATLGIPTKTLQSPLLPVRGVVRLPFGYTPNHPPKSLVT
jgi:hypothetical protein